VYDSRSGSLFLESFVGVELPYVNPGNSLLEACEFDV
jgi:hypothetical protein